MKKKNIIDFKSPHNSCSYYTNPTSDAARPSKVANNKGCFLLLGRSKGRMLAFKFKSKYISRQRAEPEMDYSIVISL